ncbi:hypothetical protein PINS_up013684 [Pythium insidiosum]|nr:hypothetical protein PINS_up013684 [Pythium insidiosum]
MSSPCISSAERQLLLLHEQLRRSVNVYLVDQRGTGRGTLFHCEASQATSRASDDGVLVSKNEVVGCASDLAAAFGPSVAAAFSLTSAALDIAELVTQLQPSTPSLLYGVGWGTLLVERVMHLNRNEIAGYVLDSTMTASGAPRQQFSFRSRSDKDAGDVAKALLALCDDDALCSTKFATPPIAKVLAAVLQNLDADVLSNGCASLLRTANAPSSLAAAFTANATAAVPPSSGSASPPSYALRRLLALMLQDHELRSLIPVVIYRMNRCSSNDRAVLFPLIERVTRQQQASLDAVPPSSVLLFDMIQFSELWETTPPPDDRELLSRFTRSPFALGVAFDQLDRFCAFTRDRSDVCRAILASSSPGSLPPPLSYTRDTFWNVGARVPDNASVLLLHSRLDSETPLRHAELLLDALDGNHKRLLIFEDAVHNVVAGGNSDSSSGSSNAASSRCAQSILASFVTQRGRLDRLDTSCMAQLATAPSLEINRTQSARILNVSDAYDGVAGVISLGDAAQSRSRDGSAAADASNASIALTPPTVNASELQRTATEITQLERSRRRYRTAFIVVLVVAVLLLLTVIALAYRMYKQYLLREEERKLRQLRLDAEEDEMEFFRELMMQQSPSDWFNYRSNRVHL